jgi:hypothetical protein
MQTLFALIELDRCDGIDPPPEIVRESDAILAALKVRAGPSLPPSGW